MYQFHISCSSTDSRDLSEFLDASSVQYKVGGLKGVDIPTVFYVTAAALTIVDILKNWVIARKTGQVNIITRSGKHCDLRKVPADDIKDAIGNDATNADRKS